MSTTYHRFQELFLSAVNGTADFVLLASIYQWEQKFIDEDWDLVYVERQGNTLTFVHTIDKAEKWRSLRIQIELREWTYEVTVYKETDWLTWEVFTHIW